MYSKYTTYLRLKFILILFFSLSIVSTSFAQTGSVSGKVIDSFNLPLQGVSVRVQNSNEVTNTNANGEYVINYTGTNPVIVFSFIGFTTQEIAVAGRQVINVTLEDDITALEDVVVVGYGTQKRATVTGPISEVKGEALVKSPQPNLSNSLAGRFSGVIATNRGGEPGSDASDIRIRGLSTTGNKDVLVVVDGVPGQLGGLDRLDPNDIESVTVLKDASAAVYGSRAANGVILVTTKGGVAGKPTVSYSFNQGFSSPTSLPDMADAATYATIVNEINFYNNPAGGMNQFYTEDEIEKFRNGSDPLNYPNTDWINTALKKHAL